MALEENMEMRYYLIGVSGFGSAHRSRGRRRSCVYTRALQPCPSTVGILSFYMLVILFAEFSF